MPDFQDTPLGRRLVRMGVMDPDTGATRRARAALCRRCHRPVMRGISADFGGRTIDADPTPVTKLGEALALLGGRATVELRWLGDRYEIDHRDHFRISGSPAGTNGIDVLVVHECDKAMTMPIALAASTLRDDEEKAIMPDDPPF